MTGTRDLRALVTGASSGIGAAYARALQHAASGSSWSHVGPTASTSLAEGLGGEPHALVLPLDLARPGAAETLHAEVEARGIAVDCLVNCAGLGHTARFDSQPPEAIAAMIDVNVRALVEMTRAFLPGMKGRGRGRIVNVASNAAFQPVPYLTVYAATKSFVLSFTEGLAEELRGTGVRVQALCPGHHGYRVPGRGRGAPGPPGHSHADDDAGGGRSGLPRRARPWEHPCRRRVAEPGPRLRRATPRAPLAGAARGGRALQAARGEAHTGVTRPFSPFAIAFRPDIIPGSFALTTASRLPVRKAGPHDREREGTTMEAAQKKAAEKPEFSEYDYSNFYYGAGDDPLNLLRPFADWYREARPSGYYLYRRRFGSAPDHPRPGEERQDRRLARPASTWPPTTTSASRTGRR